MAKRISGLLLTLICAALAACSSIGTINGVELNSNRMGVASDGPQPFCTQNTTQQWACILAGATIIGAAAAIIATADHGKQMAPPSAPAAPPPAPPPGPGR